MKVNEPTEAIIGAAIEVHKALGPGLLESAYEDCLCYELSLRGVPFERQKHLPVRYKQLQLESAYRLDLLVADQVVVEIKAWRRPLEFTKPNFSPTCVSVAGRLVCSSTSTFLE